MYSFRMSSAAILADMPYVFETREFCAAAGISPSSASRALRTAAESEMVSKIGRGLWRRRDCQQPRIATKSGRRVSSHWSPMLEMMLDRCFGNVPRRLSHLMALGMGGVPLLSGTQVSVPHECGKDLSRLSIGVFRENRSSITMFAEQITERTWVSSPTRAALEVARSDNGAPRWEERVAWVLAEGPSMLDFSEAVDIAARLKMRSGIRRISSIAYGLAQADVPELNLGLIDHDWIDCVSAGRGDKWIALRRRPAVDATSVTWSDHERRVEWGYRPNLLAGSLLT